jgi:hypothetical protein
VLLSLSLSLSLLLHVDAIFKRAQFAALGAASERSLAQRMPGSAAMVQQSWVDAPAARTIGTTTTTIVIHLGSCWLGD